MSRIAVVFVGLVGLVGCAHGPVKNELVAKHGREVSAGVTIGFGTPPRISLVIPTCYAHAQSKLGDHDKIKIELAADHVSATEGQLDIADCSTTHVTATLWARFPDGTRIDAVIDTELTEPGK